MIKSIFMSVIVPERRLVSKSPLLDTAPHHAFFPLTLYAPRNPDGVFSKAQDAVEAPYVDAVNRGHFKSVKINYPALFRTRGVSCYDTDLQVFALTKEVPNHKRNTGHDWFYIERRTGSVAVSGA
jgi:hypothetical protein